MDDKIIKDLYAYVKKEGFSGYDLYDGLNARLPTYLGLYGSRNFKLFWIQLHKSLPVNLRPFFLSPKGFNVKGGSLFMLGLINLYGKTGEKEYLGDIESLYRMILSEEIETPKGIGFGYNFDWAARAFLAKAGTPNIVVTLHVAKALLAYHTLGEKGTECVLEKIKDFVLGEMIAFENDDKLCFRYVPGDDTLVHNANLLTAEFLGDYRSLKGDGSGRLAEIIKKAVNFSVSAVREDFSMPYGTSSFHGWVDNFHTAFSIEYLIGISRMFPELKLDGMVRGLLEYYFQKLFTPGGDPKYYNNKIFPIDAHVLAETKILLNKISDSSFKDMADTARVRTIKLKNEEWIKKFWSGKGYFYARKNRLYWNRIPYIRWSQAWMFYALSTDI